MSARKPGPHRRAARPLVATAALGLTLISLSACGGGEIKNGNSGTNSCGAVTLASETWSGSTANAYVAGYVAQTKLGCEVSYVHVAEQVGWQGVSNGNIDANLENWGHQDLAKKYITQMKTVDDAGPTGGKGIIGWYVPPWMAQKYPDITNWHNLNKYASLFKTSESDGKGQLLDGDPSYVTNDEALVANLHLNFKVVVAGSEAALIQSFRQSEKDHTPLLAYFYQPHWLFSEIPLVQVKLPRYKPGCDANPATVDCGYPLYILNKQMNAKWATSGSPAVDLVRNFHWTNADQNQVTADIAQGMSPEDAAKKFVDSHATLVNTWLEGT
jgi:glycine betaine/proline transport system substrate-binding protein